MDWQGSCHQLWGVPVPCPPPGPESGQNLLDLDVSWCILVYLDAGRPAYVRQMITSACCARGL
jgi:hypothetical protein